MDCGSWQALHLGKAPEGPCCCFPYPMLFMQLL
jgi:hypothetical protein